MKKIKNQKIKIKLLKLLTSKNLKLDFQSISHFERKLKCSIWDSMGKLNITSLYHFRARDLNGSLKMLSYLIRLVMS